MPMIPPKDMTDADLLSEVKGYAMDQHFEYDRDLLLEVVKRLKDLRYRMNGLEK